MQRRTHGALDPGLCGRAVSISDGQAEVQMQTLPVMRADEHDLVHGGFVFSLADHAAMLAINHPNVVLGSASLRFERPVEVGETLLARARARSGPGGGSKKRLVDVEVLRGDEVVCRGELTCFIPERHVLESGAGR